MNDNDNSRNPNPLSLFEDPTDGQTMRAVTRLLTSLQERSKKLSPKEKVELLYKVLAILSVPKYQALLLRSTVEEEYYRVRRRLNFSDTKGAPHVELVNLLTTPRLGLQQRVVALYTPREVGFKHRNDIENSPQDKDGSIWHEYVELYTDLQSHALIRFQIRTRLAKEKGQIFRQVIIDTIDVEDDITLEDYFNRSPSTFEYCILQLLGWLDLLIKEAQQKVLELAKTSQWLQAVAEYARQSDLGYLIILAKEESGNPCSREKREELFRTLSLRAGATPKERLQRIKEEMKNGDVGGNVNDITEIPMGTAIDILNEGFSSDEEGFISLLVSESPTETKRPSLATAT